MFGFRILRFGSGIKRPHSVALRKEPGCTVRRLDPKGGVSLIHLLASGSGGRSPLLQTGSDNLPWLDMDTLQFR